MNEPEYAELEAQLQLRAALYLRVSTQRQAERQVSIPDQRRQGVAYCQKHGYSIAQIYSEEGASAMNDRRPEFRRMIEAALTPARPFDLIIVHSFSRFFRDHFAFELYARKLDRHGVKLVSTTQEIGDDPLHAMMRKVIALFDEYQSKESAKHVLRALRENARQGFWCGSRTPAGYRVVAAEQRGTKTKKKLEIDPEYAEIVRLTYRLALEGCSGSGPMGIKKIEIYLNKMGYVSPDGRPWQAGHIYRILTRRTYIGEHSFNRRSRAGSLKPEDEIIIIPVPPLVSREDFDAVQSGLRRRKIEPTPGKPSRPAAHLKGAVYCALCGHPMIVRPAQGRSFRYYTCLRPTTPEGTRCLQRTVSTVELDDLVGKFVQRHLLGPNGVEQLVEHVVETRSQPLLTREAAAEKRAAKDANQRLRRIFDAIEGGELDCNDASVAQRIDALRRLREEHLRTMWELTDLQNSRSAAASRAPTIRRAVRNALAKFEHEPDRLKKFMRLVTERVDVAPTAVRLTSVKSRLLEAVFHIADETPIPAVDRRCSSARQSGDCFTYEIERS
ncbi:recombinase family protein [Sphingopyxis panaciterrae]